LDALYDEVDNGINADVSAIRKPRGTNGGSRFEAFLARVAFANSYTCRILGLGTRTLNLSLFATGTMLLGVLARGLKLALVLSLVASEVLKNVPALGIFTLVI
jgi:hypothetical protein